MKRSPIEARRVSDAYADARAQAARDFADTSGRERNALAQACRYYARRPFAIPEARAHWLGAARELRTDRLADAVARATARRVDGERAARALDGYAREQDRQARSFEVGA